MSNDSSRTARSHCASWLQILALACLVAVGSDAGAQTALADAPLFSTVNAPGNLSMVLSVEFPTAVSVAHANRTYSSTSTYLGYFDEAKCYTYQSSSTDPTTSAAATPGSYFVPAAFATAHRCAAASGTTGQWSGNFLNWASMQTIDTFRWVLTGGYRVLDTAGGSGTAPLTVIEKAWASGQGGSANFPDSQLAVAEVAGATPFGALNGPLSMRINGLGNQMRFVVAPAYAVKYYNSTDLSGPVVVSRYEGDTSAIQGGVSPAPGVTSTYFSASYTISVTAPTTGSYTFQTVSDDGVHMDLDGTRIIDNWPSGGQSPTSAFATVSLTAGTVHTITLQYRQFGGGATLQLAWQLPGATAYTPVVTTNSLYGTTTDYTTGTTATQNTVYSVFMRAKMCDATVGLEANCTAYAGGYKPEGLMQKYSNKLRYSAFGYLNDGTSTRDAGVLRAAQKFIGPTAPVYGAPAATNLAGEWNSVTGVLTADPDCSSSNPDKPTGTQCPTASSNSSGVINYINKFGELAHAGYKTYDPVSELYYAAIRYFKNLGDVPEWSDMSTLSAYDRNRVMDGFPVLTNPKDPIIGSCQRNFILGIGDTHTWLDKNVPGNTNTSGEPALPSAVAADNPASNPAEISPYNAVVATNKVGAMESGGTSTALGTTSPYGSCCTANSALMAGLAYDAHTTGIRAYGTGSSRTVQTLDTYWLDVQEGGHYEPNNQYYLATKYGGFKVPSGFKPYDAGTTTLDPSTWWNGVDYLTYGSTSNKRPNNYYSAGQPDQMQAGLISAFADAAATATASYSTTFALPVPQVGPDGSSSFAGKYVPATWSGDLVASKLTFDSTGTPVAGATVWNFADKLKTQAAGTGTSRVIATWNGVKGVPFELPTASPAGITAVQLATLDTSYISGNDAATYLTYLRGDTSHEIPAGGADSTHYYRTRAGPLGDIVDSKPVVVGAPAFPYGDTSNPGYAAFKGATPARATVAYVGANDGMLHAVDASITASTGGQELFAYVPSALFAGPSGTPSVDGLASLGNPSFVHHYMVDGPTAFFDIDFARTTGATTTTPAWRTVLIGALGKGGKSYYAIDITDPSSMTTEAAVAGKVLWEYSNATSLGYTYGKPVVVKVRKYGWVVAIPSGYNNTDGYGHIIFLNPRTGALLEDVRTPIAAAGLAQLNAYILDPTDGTADAFYAGDLDGNLWRLDVTQTSTTAAFPSPVRIASFVTPASGSTAAKGQPITTVPFVQIDPDTRRRFVLVGTGRLLDSTDISSPQVQSFYAIWDGNNVAFSATPTAGGTSAFPITRSDLLARSATDTTSGATAIDFTNKSGWYVDLGSTTDPTTGVVTQSRLVSISNMTTTYGQVAFAATVPTGTMCAPGGTSLDYAFAFGLAQSSLLVAPGTVATLPYLAVTDTTTNLSFTSNNGALALIYGLTNNGAVAQLTIGKLGSQNPHRVNWREVPLVD